MHVLAPVLVDGTTQPGYDGAFNRIDVEGAAGVNEIFFLQAHNGTTIKGIGLYNYNANGVTIWKDSNWNYLDDDYIGFKKTGLADARNVGTRIARAPYIFMMDADNLVTPPALSLLFHTMKREQCAAAYSILCRFRKTAAHPVGLLSHYDWDPEILVQGPYVDAMAMFRRDVLLELGGYDHTLSEIGWFGWEDYDMWLRFAQRDLPVGFVPNILCLYRQHETSMINTTNLFAHEFVRLFQERYHSFANRFAPREELFGVKRSELASATEIISTDEEARKG